MKRMLLLSLIVSSVQSLAQIGVGAEFGINANTYYARNSSGNGSPMHAGIRTGLKADIPVYKWLHIRAGLLYAGNDYAPGASRIGGGHPEMNIRTVEAPCQFIYQARGTKVAAPWVGLGPYIGYNFGGRIFIPGGGIYPGPRDPDITRQLNIGSGKTDDIKLLDAGISVAAGLQLTQGVCLSVLYQRGWVNLKPGGGSEFAFRAFNLGMALSYYVCKRTAGHKPQPATTIAPQGQ